MPASHALYAMPSSLAAERLPWASPDISVTCPAFPAGLAGSGLVVSEGRRSLLDKPVPPPDYQTCPTGPDSCTCYSATTWRCVRALNGYLVTPSTGSQERCQLGQFERDVLPASECNCVSSELKCVKTKYDDGTPQGNNAPKAGQTQNGALTLTSTHCQLQGYIAATGCGGVSVGKLGGLRGVCLFSLVYNALAIRGVEPPS